MKRQKGAMVLAALLSLAAGLQAQDPTPVRGARVRVQTELRRQQIGFLTMMNADSVVVRDVRGAPTQTFYAPEVRRLDVSTGRSSFTGAARGAGVGLLMGGISGALAGSRSSGTEPQDVMTAMGAVMGAGAGAAIGIIAGALIGAERWTLIAWPAHVRASGQEAAMVSLLESAGTQLADTAAMRSDIGRKVRLTLADGARHKGLLAYLNDSSVAIVTGGAQRRYLLTDVSRVELSKSTVGRTALLSGLIGFAVGFVASCGAGDEETCWPELGAAAGVLTAGIGAAAAALRDRATAERNVIYPVGAR